MAAVRLRCMNITYCGSVLFTSSSKMHPSGQPNFSNRCLLVTLLLLQSSVSADETFECNGDAPSEPVNTKYGTHFHTNFCLVFGDKLDNQTDAAPPAPRQGRLFDTVPAPSTTICMSTTSTPPPTPIVTLPAAACDCPTCECTRKCPTENKIKVDKIYFDEKRKQCKSRRVCCNMSPSTVVTSAPTSEQSCITYQPTPGPSSITTKPAPVPSRITTTAAPVIPVPSSITTTVAPVIPVPSSITTTAAPGIPVPSSITTKTAPVPSRITTTAAPVPSSTVTLAPLLPTQTEEPNKQIKFPTEDNCTHSFEHKNGKIQTNNFPYVVKITEKQRKTEFIKCAGIILNEHLILTSTYCLNSDRRYYKVYAPYQMEGVDDVQARRVKTLDRGKEFGVGILRLSQPLTLTSQVSAACWDQELPSVLPQSTVCFRARNPETPEAPSNSILLPKQVVLASHQACKEKIARVYQRINLLRYEQPATNFICSNDDNDEVGDGDLAAPLMCELKGRTGHFKLAGVMVEHGVYMSVAPMREWLKKITNN